MVRVFYFDISPLYNTKIYESALSSVGESRRKKAEQLINKEDKCLCVGASLLLSYALKSMGVQNYKIKIAKGGKPYLEDKSVHFSLSHSSQMVFCALSDSPVGIDAELIADYNPKLSARFFTKSEDEYINLQKNEAEKRDAFFRIWTIKESYAKYTGRGISSFGQFEVVMKDAPFIRGAELCSVDEFTIDRYAVALCSREDEVQKPQKITLCQLLETDG